jgi:hypothetical protein
VIATLRMDEPEGSVFWNRLGSQPNRRGHRQVPTEAAFFHAMFVATANEVSRPALAGPAAVVIRGPERPALRTHADTVRLKADTTYARVAGRLTCAPKLRRRTRSLGRRSQVRLKADATYCSESQAGCIIATVPNTPTPEADDAHKDHRPATSQDSKGKGNAVDRDLDVSDDELDGVRGGKTPTPSGPIPIPYPN